jgi:uncharacterized protein (DUF1800 family)
MPQLLPRRTLLGALSISLALTTPPSGVAQQAPTAREREQTADQQVRHAIARLSFGARPGDYERIRTTGVDRWIAEQLEPARIANAEAERRLAGFPSLRQSTAELLRQYPQPQQVRAARAAGRGRTDSARAAGLSREDSLAIRRAGMASQRLIGDLQMARVLRASTSERQLEEVMVDFWINHFSVFGGKGPTRYFLAEYEREAIRPHALGSFREMLGAVAKSPAMLFYLDNWQSSVEQGRPSLRERELAAARRRAGVRAGRGRGDPRRDSLAARLARMPRGLNENYARELLELHTMGVQGGYTQADVVNVARAFTGWSLEQPRERGAFIFRPVMHDAGDKVVLGKHLPSGRGVEDGDAVLDLLAGHPSTAHFIATKLARRFVSDDPPAALIDRAAETFMRTHGDIRETVREIVTSPEFFSAAAYRAKVKSPFELVVSALRAMNAAPDTTPRTARLIAALGQPLYLHQTPNGYPETGEPWINTGTILNRINLGIALASERVPGVRLANWPASAELRDATRSRQVDGVIHALLGGEASPDTRRILESGANPMLEVAGADTLAASLDPPDDAMDPQMPGLTRGRRGRSPLRQPAELEGLAQVVGLALGSPEFQRR